MRLNYCQAWILKGKKYYSSKTKHSLDYWSYRIWAQTMQRALTIVVTLILLLKSTEILMLILNSHWDLFAITFMQTSQRSVSFSQRITLQKWAVITCCTDGDRAMFWGSDLRQHQGSLVWGGSSKCLMLQCCTELKLTPKFYKSFQASGSAWGEF